MKTILPIVVLLNIALSQVAGPTLEAPPNGATDIDPTSTIILNWSNVNNVGYYELQVEDNSSFSNPIIDEVMSPSIYYISANTLNFLTTYYWRVRGWHTSGPWNGYPTLWSDISSFTTSPEPDTTPPATPTGLAATPGNGQVVLTWTANSESDLASYKVYGGTSASPTTLLSTVIAGTETYTHSSLTNGTTYYYRISAVDNDGNESDKTSDVSATPTYSGPTWHVSTSGSDSNDGSEGSPFATIQHGIDVSTDGDTVMVAAGTYLENINYNGKNIAVQGENKETTIIDGSQSGSVVTFENGEDSTAVLNEFTITNGLAEDGGGIYCYYSSPNIKNCLISNNEATHYYGGGVYVNHGSPIIDKCVIINNKSLGAGGGLDSEYDCNITIRNSTIVGNTSTQQVEGGGISNNQNSTTEIINTILWNNSPDQIENDDYNSELIITYSDIQGSWEGEGNIDADPLFCNANSGDFMVRSDSPVLGASLNLSS